MSFARLLKALHLQNRHVRLQKFGSTSWCEKSACDNEHMLHPFASFCQSVDWECENGFDAPCCTLDAQPATGQTQNITEVDSHRQARVTSLLMILMTTEQNYFTVSKAGCFKHSAEKGFGCGVGLPPHHSRFTDQPPKPKAKLFSRLGL
eukprot:Skav221732  [mRNA]  locus=scaffold542:417313:417759:+ [translate_table: standard]